MEQMFDRQNAHWRIIYDATRGWGFPYYVQYKIEGREWKEWNQCETRLGARFVLWRAKRMSKPIGGEMVIYESEQPIAPESSALRVQANNERT